MLILRKYQTSIVIKMGPEFFFSLLNNGSMSSSSEVRSICLVQSFMVYLHQVKFNHGLRKVTSMEEKRKQTTQNQTQEITLHTLKTATKKKPLMLTKL